MRLPRRRTTRAAIVRALAGVLLAACLFIQSSAALADAAFERFIQSLWPAAEQLGVSRATFEAATRGLEPDLSLPDLVIPGRVDRQPAQAEFVQTPADYLREQAFANLAAQGRKHLEQHRATLAGVEQRFGVPGPIVLAIWARETNYGAAKLPYSAIRALATQAYLGRRKEQFRDEFLLALKTLEEGHVTLAAMRSSWGGALGQPQLLPSNFYKYAVDFDGDGHKDIWSSVPDVLATIANHLRSARAAECRLHDRAAGRENDDRRVDEARLCAGSRPCVHRRRTQDRSFLADAGRAVRSRLSHAAQLFRAEGL
jgi:lytic murein transglycosylase